MSRKLSIIVFLCVAVLLPSVATAQLSVFAKQRVVIADVIDRNDRPINPVIIKLILQGYTEMISGSEDYEVSEVNLNDVKNRLKTKGLTPNFANISKEIGKQADYIVFTTVKSSSSAVGSQSSDVTIFISTSLYRISTASEVLADQDKSVPTEQSLLSTSSALISRMLGLKNKPRSQQILSVEQTTQTTQVAQQTQQTLQQQTQQDKVWKVGDYYEVNGKKGVVIVVTPDGKHGKMISITQTQSDWNAAKSWCSNLGNGWRLATKSELFTIYKQKDKINNNSTLEAIGDILVNDFYWSSDVNGSDQAWQVSMNSGYSYSNNKGNTGYVRAVSAF